ncbi:hypothetical protein [Prescottella agglutinans]|uniref:hypothetical protein n=1 Tax=Prescottella agglutinans TaxID=1644129 RepID=UPI000FDE996E|nr:hypothetical protein [Prescottella agglutinans]
MDTGSLVDLVTSVDVGSLAAPIGNGLNGIVNAIFNVVGGVIALWPAGSSAVAGSLDAALGSVGTVLGSIGGQ